MATLTKSPRVYYQPQRRAASSGQAPGNTGWEMMREIGWATGRDTCGRLREMYLLFGEQSVAVMVPSVDENVRRHTMADEHVLQRPAQRVDRPPMGSARTGVDAVFGRVARIDVLVEIGQAHLGEFLYTSRGVWETVGDGERRLERVGETGWERRGGR